MNNYYTKATDVIPYSRAKDTDVDTPLELIEEAFDKLVAPHPNKQGFGAPVPMSDATALDEGVTAGQVVNSTLTYASDTGTAGAYAVALDVAPPAYANGLIVMFRATNANAGAATLNVNGLGVKNLTDYAGRALLADDILAGSVVMAIYDDGKFKIISHFDQYDGSAAAYAAQALASAGDSADSASDSLGYANDSLGYANDSLGYANQSKAYRDQAQVYQAATLVNHATFLKYQW